MTNKSMKQPSFGHSDTSSPFLIEELELGAPVQGHDDTWSLVYRPAPGQAIPLILTAFHYDNTGVVHAMICAPRFDYTNFAGPTLHMMMDMQLARTKIPLGDLPVRHDEWPAFVLAIMAAQQTEDEITTLNGSHQKLRELLQDAADFTGGTIEIRCAIDAKSEPYVHISGLAPLASRSITDIVHFFHPVGGRAPGGHDWMNERTANAFGSFYPREPSGHERLEIGARLKAFFAAHGKNMKIGKKALQNRLKALGLSA